MQLFSFGNGYKFTIKAHMSHDSRHSTAQLFVTGPVKDFIATNLPGAVLLEEHNTELEYEVASPILFFLCLSLSLLL